MPAYEPTERTRVRRKPGRGNYDREMVDGILDEALICHLGFVESEQPFVIPTIHARVGTKLYLHGSKASRTLRALEDGIDCCVTVTLIDGLVLARSALHHSLNYRSAMIFGVARRVEDSEEKALALEAVVEHIAPGRADDARAPSGDELDATEVVALELEEASAKVREGGPIDADDDMDLPVWAGQLPLSIAPLQPVAEPDLSPDVELPAYLRDWRRPSSGELPGLQQR
jgi:nitroimidazol reductase NimA-like FMN-containing flavoprotein (pyridoxamine 5'-phosphate oxidase superfamily)